MSFEKMSNTYFSSRTASSLQKKAIKLGFKSGFRAKIYSHDINFWKNPNLINSYWAGFSGADSNLSSSCLCYSLQIQSRDGHHLEKLREQTGYSGTIRYYKSYPKLSIAGCGEWYKDLLSIWSITPAKTFTLQPPTITDDELIKAYIVGFIDGDGYIVYRGERRRMRIGIVNASYSVLDWMRGHIERLYPHTEKVGAVAPKLIKIAKSNNSNCYFLHMGGLRAVRILNKLRQHPVPRLSRKWDDPRLVKQIELDKIKYPHLFLDNPTIPV